MVYWLKQEGAVMAEDENHKTQGFVQRVLTCCVSSAILIAIFSVATFLLVQISDFIIPDPDEPDRPTKSVAATKTPTPPEVTPTMSPPTVAPATFTPPTNWPPTSRPTPAVIATVAPPTVAPPSVDELLQQASASADRGDGAATVALFEKIKTISPARLEGRNKSHRNSLSSTSTQGRHHGPFNDDKKFDVGKSLDGIGATGLSG